MLHLSSLQGKHRDMLNRAVTNALSTTNAEITYGQIIDGPPLSKVARDTYSRNTCPGHPLLEVHLELSAETLDQAQQLRENFDPDSLLFDSMVCISAKPINVSN